MGRFANVSSSSLRRAARFEDEDPTSGLANLADCMLVLACGLMVALVVAWNIDLNVTEVQKADEYREVSSIESVTGEYNSGGTSYVDMGRIFQDPETGKLYMVEEGGSSNASSSSSENEAGE